MLYQKQDGKLRVIRYGSRSLSAAERNYHLHLGKLEFLALKWAITEHFRDYLYYAQEFTVYTHNNPLTYVLTTAKLNAELADFRFNLKYRPGRSNGDGGALSRMPLDFTSYMERYTESISPNLINATITGVVAQGEGSATWVSAVSHDEAVLGLDEVTLGAGQTPIHSNLLLQPQRQDKAIGRVLALKSAGKRPSAREAKREPSATRTLLR